jgi:RNA polymerase sigma-70 factor (ECF subfamily)
MEADELREQMRRYQEGDESAFDALYRALASRIYGYLFQSTRDRVLADDLLQEVFFNVHRARATYRPGSPVLPWVFAIARHAAASRARSAGRRAKREEAREDLSDLPAAAPEDPAEDPRIDEIRAVLEELPAPQREAVMLLKVSGLSVAEAAAATGSTAGAIKLRAHRAYEAIRKRLGTRSAGSPKKERTGS